MWKKNNKVKRIKVILRLKDNNVKDKRSILKKNIDKLIMRVRRNENDKIRLN